ncbi:MAG: hypothetical protein ABIP77_00230 [Candidatus Limnocylindrales bacterium]
MNQVVRPDIDDLPAILAEYRAVVANLRRLERGTREWDFQRGEELRLRNQIWNRATRTDSMFRASAADPRAQNFTERR